MFWRKTPKSVGAQPPPVFSLKKFLALLFSLGIAKIVLGVVNPEKVRGTTQADYARTVFLEGDLMEQIAHDVVAVPEKYGLPLPGSDSARFEAELVGCSRSSVAQWLSSGDPRLVQPVARSDMKQLVTSWSYRFIGSCVDKLVSENEPRQ